jgi:O-antigen ligase
MSFNHLARYAALFWGLVVFMPVGLNYLAFFTLILCMSIQSGRVERVRRVRQHLIFWPLAAFVLWSVIVLVLQPTLYEQTPSNLWHIVRIALTLALALALTPEEAAWAVRGFAMAVIAALVVIGLNHLIGLPDWTIWSSLLKITGNKTIGNNLLLTVAAGSGIVIALDRPQAAVRALALVLVCAVLAVIVWALPNRTSLLILVLAPVAVLCHQWRQYRAKLVIALAAAVVMAGSLLVSVPSMHDRLAQGFNDIERARGGTWSHDSWGIRLQMYRETASMVADHPLMGWGIGGWTSQWQQRAPAEFAAYNMPHNDYLWMGAQAGVPGGLLLLSLLAAACFVGWRRPDNVGRMAFLAALTLLFAALVNSAIRDANIGLALLWIAGIYLRLASDPGFSLSVFSPTRLPARTVN